MLFVLLFFKTLNVCHNVIFCVHHCDRIPISGRSYGIFLFMKSPMLKAWTFALLGWIRETMIMSGRY
jgi:hypothetical protein